PAEGGSAPVRLARRPARRGRPRRGGGAGAALSASAPAATTGGAARPAPTPGWPGAGFRAAGKSANLLSGFAGVRAGRGGMGRAGRRGRAPSRPTKGTIVSWCWPLRGPAVVSRVEGQPDGQEEP